MPELPVIIEVALNGQTRQSLQPHVPRTTDEIAEDGLRCAAAGASIVHTHISEIAVDPPRAAELYLEHFRPMLAAHPDLPVYPTVGVGHSIELRMGHPSLGLEDFAGPEHPTNQELVERAVALCEQVGRPVATPLDTARILDLPATAPGS